MRFFNVLSLQIALAVITTGAFAQITSSSVTVVGKTNPVVAGSNFRPRPTPPKRDRQVEAPASNQPQAPLTNDSDLVRAVSDGRNVNFVQGAGVIVTRVLPDDNSGLPHQRWYVRLSNGKEIIAIYNSDMGQRVPVKPGVVMSLGGEFKMTNLGPMIHWLHSDPQGTRPNGFVIIQGVRYGGN